MKCPKCHADNSDTSRFCGNCATQLMRGGQRPDSLTKTFESPVHALSKGSLVAGKYRIIEEIGRGGMGIVYKAEDTTLARSVAIKVLPEVFTDDPERLARFEREAKLLASLNHPNIATIFGLEETNGERFLVMELVDGETLGERIRRGPLPLEQALKVCLQIAEGVEAAHERGIIHRDLKPANVKLTPDDKVKVLDFGLAKAFYEGGEASDPSNSPTITEQMTEAGVILGTAAYMSPEQAKGKPVDKRADIWAFGCILYECLTGKRAFPGDTATESMATILRGEPDWDSLPADTPGYVRALLRRCLRKEPKERVRDIGDARVEILEGLSEPDEVIPVFRRFSPRRLLSIGAGLLLVGLLSGMLAMKFLKPPASSTSQPVASFHIKVEPGHWLDGLQTNAEANRPTRTALVISNDGSFIVYSAIAENPGPRDKPRLYLRRINELEAKPIAGTEGGIQPFLSPDDRWVGFWADGKLYKIPIEGGVPATMIYDTGNSFAEFGASWHDNTIVFTEGDATGLSRISADGGQPEFLTHPDPKREESSHRLPFWLPDGRAVLFTVMRHVWDTQPWVALLQLQTREWRVLLQNAAEARYVPTGHLVFLRQGTLMAVRFDLDRLQVLGQPYSVLEDVMQALVGGSAGTNSAAGQLSVSRTGTLLYARGGVLPPREDSLVWVDQKGVEQPVAPLTFPFFAPRLSPDGQRIAYGTGGKEWQIWVYDLTRGTNSRLTSEGWATYPVWTSDGKRLIFNWQKSGVPNLFWQAYDGSSPMERLTTSEYEEYPGSWSPDRERLVLVEIRPGTGGDIALFETRSGRISSFLNSKNEELYPELSPDGRWIAYTSDETGRNEVYIRPFPGPGGKWQVSGNGGMQPLWSKNGKHLFYRWWDQMWAVDIQTGSSFSISNRRMLFVRPGYGWGHPIRSYDLSLDGQQFLMIKPEQRKPSPITEMILIQNWFEELKRLVPTGKK